MKTLSALAVAFTALLANAADPETPLKELPYTPGLDVSAMDRTVDPCVDFYQYSCGGWLRNNPIPSDQASWDIYRKVAQDNQRYLWGILDGLAANTAGRNPIQQRLGDYFAACMDEEAVEKLGARPLAAYFTRIEAMTSKRDLPATLAHLHLDTGDSGLLFGFGSNQDFADSSQVIAFAGHGGMGLPDRDYYLKDDDKSKEIRAKYLVHVAKMFELVGDAPEVAKRNASKVMEIETALATGSLTRVDRRDPHKIFHKMDRKGLAALTPGFDWNLYLKAVGLDKVRTFNVTEPEFYKAVDAQLAALDLADLKTYLRWHVAHATSPYLAKAFVNESFDFFSKTLRDVPELKPRWKRCTSLVDGQLGEALGQEFVRRTFSATQKRKTQRMARQVLDAMGRDIKDLPWMTAETKQRALQKLKAITTKVGYPDKWRDYSSVVVKRDDFFGNVERATRFESRRDLAKIGRPLDRTEWYMTPPTVNAYFDSQLNDINFPAGVLQPPLYDPKMDDAPNYGNTGGTIGHEITHGFDDQGRKFDAKGNLKDWWSKKDDEAFTERANCIRDQYSNYVVVGDLKINGDLTLGEDTADLGGMILAWMAWKAETVGKKLEDRDGLTPEQRFFVGFGQANCENDRDENARMRVLTDPHSPAKYRVNGLVPNLTQFEKAFSCKPGQPMAPEKRCRVW